MTGWNVRDEKIIKSTVSALFIKNKQYSTSVHCRKYISVEMLITAQHAFNTM